MKALYRLCLLVAIAATAAAIFAADGYQVYIIVLVGLTAMVGVGLNILLGLTGQISLGHVGFYAIGAYTGAILTTTYAWSFWLALPLAGIVAGAAGTLLAIPALRVRGPYLAMITIAFAFVVEQGAAEWKDVTGGWNGIMFIPMPDAFGHEFVERDIALLVLALTVVSVFLFARLRPSTWGMAMRAVRDSETAGQSLGLNPVAIRTVAFTLSAVIAGVAGAVFASITAFISPESFPFLQSILFLLVAIIGGIGTVLGPVAGALVVVLVPEFLSFLAEYRLLFVGILLLVVLLAAPRGIVGEIERRLRRTDPRPAEAGDIDIAAFLSEGRSDDALLVDDLCISFGGVAAVDDVSFAARSGQVTSIIGPNGAGKTTVLNLIGGFYKPDSGIVRLGDRNVAGQASHIIARAGIARTYQTTQLFENISVLENLEIALRRGNLGSITRALFGGVGGDDSGRGLAEALLVFVGYTGPVEQTAGALPHIDKRLVEIARALAIRPQVLLLDEPAAGLGRNDTEGLGHLLRRIADTGVTVIIVEHDMSLVMGISDHIYVLDAGRRIADGSPAEVRANADVRKAYLGDSDFAGRGRPEAWQPSDQPVLEIEALTAGYGAAPVLQAVDLSVRSGEMVAVLGANGAGKSTLMRTVTGLHRPEQGNVLLLGRDITKFTANRIAGEGLILVPEGRQVFPEFSVVDNIRLGAYARSDFDDGIEVEAMLDRFPKLRERAGSRAGLLSGGEQQMLAIARGLVAKPTILLLDEPSLGLAPTLINELFEVLAELRDEGITILLVDQMAGLALSVADRGYILESGRIVHQGTTDEIRDDPALEQAYLGEAGISGQNQASPAPTGGME
ncbi:MAG: ATP-binding cassette domain-containing protein [Alphaproteobacteria bacterium]|nr:ATP-binding cassette domain-containing protein [Alphaproteobacteria bacterium]